MIRNIKRWWYKILNTRDKFKIRWESGHETSGMTYSNAYGQISKTWAGLNYKGEIIDNF